MVCNLTLNGLVFCTPGEVISDLLGRQTDLDSCFISFRNEFISVVRRIDTSSTSMVEYFADLKRRNTVQSRLILIGGDLTKPRQIIDLCGVLLFYC